MQGQYVGELYLNLSADMVLIQDPPTATLQMSTTLVLNTSLSYPELSVFPAVQDLAQRPNAHSSDATTSTTTTTSTPSVLSNCKKTVNPQAAPIAPKSASFYAKGAEKPTGMTKNESDSCLTCLRNNRRCKGTEINLIKGNKRCANCVKPGKNTSGRVCYWRDPSRNVHTYEDAQRELAEELGGRILEKNTRAGRVERQQETASQSDERNLLSNTETTGANSVSDAEMEDDCASDTQMTDTSSDHVDTIENNIGLDLFAATQSAHWSVCSVITQDLGLHESDHSLETILMVEQSILDALDGIGPYQDRVLGINHEILNGIHLIVEANIALYRAMQFGD